MATHDWTGSPAATSGGQEFEDQYTQNVVVKYFDCSTNNMTGSDVYQIWKVGNGVLPTAFRVYVATAEGGAATLDIGDGSSTTRYETDANLNSTGYTTTLDATTMYTTNDTIDIIPSADLDTAKFYVVMEFNRLTT